MTRYYPPQSYVPFEPLEQFFDGLTTGPIALRCGVSRETVHRWRRQGFLPLFAADRIAIRLNVHPIVIWSTFHDSEEYLCHT